VQDTRTLTMATDAVGDDGRVVRELDVYLCAGNVPEATKVAHTDAAAATATAFNILHPPVPVVHITGTRKRLANAQAQPLVCRHSSRCFSTHFDPTGAHTTSRTPTR